MASLNSSLNNLRGRSSDGRSSMPNLPSSGATSRGASGHADPHDEFIRKQLEAFDDIARRLRSLNQYSPPSRTQIRGRPSSRESVLLALLLDQDQRLPLLRMMVELTMMEISAEKTTILLRLFLASIGTWFLT
jgi:hypothetical protein